MLWFRYCLIVLNGTRGGSFVLRVLMWGDGTEPLQCGGPQIYGELWEASLSGGTDVAVMRPQVVLIKDRHKTQQS